MVLIYDTTQHYNDYFAALKARIKFKSLDGDDTWFTWDAFVSPGSNPFAVVYADVERAIGETGIFNIIIEDSDSVIDQSKLRNMKVYLELGKSQSAYKQFFIGFADIFQIRRPRTNYQEYLITGPSTRIQAAELYLSRREASKIQSITDSTKIPDPNFNVNKIFENSLTKRSWRPLNHDDIQEMTGWTPDMISSDVSVNYPVINEPLTTVWDFWDRLTNIAGAIWDIDYSIADVENVLLSYHPAMHTGITIKSGDLKGPNDDATKTSYIKSDFTVEDNASADSGTATRLYSVTLQDRVVIASQDHNHGFNTLDFRALAQQVIIENDQRRITDFAFILSKVGDPTSPQDRVNGDFVLDSGDNKPTGQVIATFSIPLSSLKTTPETVFVNDVDVKIRFLEGSNKAWLRLFQRSGTGTNNDGQPQHDPANTVKWHHNNEFTAQTLYSAQAPEGDKDKKATLAWSATNLGPTYTFSIFSNIRRLQARTNWQQARKIRMKEAVVDSSFLSDPTQVSSFLSVNLARTSKSRRSVTEMRVMIPNNFLFAPYQYVSFNDGLSGTSQELQVQRVRYVMSALPGDPQIGALHADISLGGLFNPLIGTCSCDG